jgi:hypothetical protein
MQIVTVAELKKELLKFFDYSQFVLNDDFLTLNHGGYNYDISLQELKTNPLFWIRQIEEKSWMSRQELRKFIEIVCNLNGV